MKTKSFKKFLKTSLYFLSYCVIRCLGFGLAFFSQKAIQRLGNVLGLGGYYLLSNFRKRVINNLAIANKLNVTADQKIQICKESFQNLAITCLEFYCLKKRAKQMSTMITSRNQEKATELLTQGQGVIFLLGHMANWEIPFIEITKNFAGIAIGKPLKNPFLNRWILSVREVNNGQIVYPRNAITSGLKALKRGHFVGIVGDQALPESSYSYPFLGVRAWTSPTPALLAYRTGCPVVVCTVQRENHHYFITYSDPIWPDLNQPLKKEIYRIMDQSMGILEQGILKCPGQWLWQHDRWKQAGTGQIKKKYRHAFILIILSDKVPLLQNASVIARLKKIYPQSFLTFCLPTSQYALCENILSPEECVFYESARDLLLNDRPFQFVIDFSNNSKIEHHFKNLGSLRFLSVERMKKRALRKQEVILLKKENLLDLVTFSLCKHGYAS